MITPRAPEASRCAECGADNRCAVAANDGGDVNGCWCRAVKIFDRHPDLPPGACLCARCLSRYAETGGRP